LKNTDFSIGKFVPAAQSLQAMRKAWLLNESIYKDICSRDKEAAQELFPFQDHIYFIVFVAAS
jgi:hypothetical protein